MLSGRFNFLIDGNSKIFERQWLQNLKNSVTFNLKARVVMKVDKVNGILRYIGLFNVAKRCYRGLLI